MADEPRRKVGMADPATIKKALEADRLSSIAEARKGLYSSAKVQPDVARAHSPAPKKPAPAIDALRGIDALLNRKKQLAKALKDAGA